MGHGHPTAAASQTTTDLHVCRACSAPFVVPTAILAVLAPTRGYIVELRCNNCGAFRVGVHDDAALEALDAELERSRLEIVRDAELLTAVRFEHEIECFANALAAGHIVPEDF